MSIYTQEWDCCGSTSTTEAWEPERCPFCEVDAVNAKLAKVEAERDEARRDRDRLARILAVERGDESLAPEGWRYVQYSARDMGRWYGPGGVTVERYGRGSASWLLLVDRAGYGFEHALIALESPYATRAAAAALGRWPGGEG
jgi:hypothetical protein